MLVKRHWGSHAPTPAVAQLAHKLQNNERQVQCIFLLLYSVWILHSPSGRLLFLYNGSWWGADDGHQQPELMLMLLLHCSTARQLEQCLNTDVGLVWFGSFRFVLVLVFRRAVNAILVRAQKCFLIALKILFKCRAHMVCLSRCHAKEFHESLDILLKS